MEIADSLICIPRHAISRNCLSCTPSYFNSLNHFCPTTPPHPAPPPSASQYPTASTINFNSYLKRVSSQQKPGTQHTGYSCSSPHDGAPKTLKFGIQASSESGRHRRVFQRSNASRMDFEKVNLGPSQTSSRRFRKQFSSPKTRSTEHLLTLSFKIIYLI